MAQIVHCVAYWQSKTRWLWLVAWSKKASWWRQKLKCDLKNMWKLERQQEYQERNSYVFRGPDLLGEYIYNEVFFDSLVFFKHGVLKGIIVSGSESWESSVLRCAWFWARWSWEDTIVEIREKRLKRSLQVISQNTQKAFAHLAVTPGDSTGTMCFSWRNLNKERHFHVPHHLHFNHLLNLICSCNIFLNSLTLSLLHSP